MRSTSALEDWCEHHLSNVRDASVEGELVWPEEPDGEVTTELEAREAREQAAKDAAMQETLAGYREEYRAHLAAAQARLAHRRGLHYTPLIPGTTAARVVVRDGQYLGTVSKERGAAGFRWRINGPSVTAQQHSEPLDTLAGAVAYLDRITPPPTAPAS